MIKRLPRCSACAQEFNFLEGTDRLPAHGFMLSADGVPRQCVGSLQPQLAGDKKAFVLIWSLELAPVELRALHRGGGTTMALIPSGDIKALGALQASQPYLFRQYRYGAAAVVVW